MKGSRRTVIGGEIVAVCRGILFCAFVALLLSGCATTGIEGGARARKASGVCYANLDAQLRVLDLKGLFGAMAGELCQDRAQPEKVAGEEVKGDDDAPQAAVLVTDFVDLTSLTPRPAGILMGEMMRSSLNTVCGYSIQQAELSRYFTLTDKGLAVLTRDSSSIRKDSVGSSDFVVGTFSQTPDKLVLFVKMFDLESGTISRMATREIEFNCLGDKISYRVR